MIHEPSLEAASRVATRENTCQISNPKFYYGFYELQ